MARGVFGRLLGKKQNANAENLVAPKGEALLIHVTDADFEEKVLQADLPVLVDFWAEWCMPCRMVGPIVAELAHDYKGRVLVAKLDTDANPQTAMRYGIMGIPTLILFEDGQEVERIVGVRPKPALTLTIERALDRS